MTQKTTTAYTRLLGVLTKLGATVAKTAINPAFKNGYVPLPELLPIVKPALEEAGFILTQPLFDTGRNGTVGIGTEIIDAASGDVLLSSRLALPCDEVNPQKATGAVTYGRRTGISSLLGIAEKDDDGNAASAPAKRAEAGAKTADPKKLW